MSVLKTGDVINIDVHARAEPKANRDYKYNRTAEDFEQWKRGIASDLRTVPGWKDYDGLFLTIASTYNTWHIADKAMQRSLGALPMIDALTLKTLACLETGPNAQKQAWKKNPMQIANPGDTGIDDVLGHDNFHKKMSDLIIPPQYRYITLDLVRKNPRENIIAATAYILMRHCTFATVTFIQDNDVKEFITTKDVYRFGDIAKANGSTEDVIKLLNPDKNPKSIRVGDKIMYQASERKMVVKQFNSPTWDSIADFYNVSGENTYGKKLAVINALLRQGY